MKVIILSIILIISFQTKAQDAFIIKDVKLFDGEKIIKNTSVKVVGDKIEEVSPDLEATEEIEIINGKGKTLMPALSNAHVHAWTPQALKEAACAGVLNVMDMHGVEPFQVGMRNLKDSTGYARYYAAGYAATAPEGHGTQFGFPVPTIEQPGDAKKFVNDRIKAKVDYIKIIIEPYKATLTIETVAEIIKEAHQANLKAVVHVSNLNDAIEVTENNADALVHIWWDKPISPEKLKLLAENQDFFIIPTLLTTLKAFESMGEKATDFLSKVELLNEIKKLHQAGIPILAGTDPPNLEINYGSDLYEELFLLSEADLSNIEVLKSATINTARAFNLKNVGLIKKGYLADMLLIEGNPTKNIKDIKNIEIIWKAGKLMD